MIGRPPSRRRRLLWPVVALTVTLALAGFLVWAFVAGRSEATRDAEEDAPIKAPSRVATVNGATVVTLDAAARKLSGIETATPQPIAVEAEIRAYATVLDLAPLTELHNAYLNAKAQLQAEQAKLTAAQAAFERARTLFADRQNMSAAQLQAAEAAYQAGRAGVAAAQSQLRTLTAAATQSWGTALGPQLVADSPLVGRLIERQAFLVQVTLPPGIAIDAPPARLPAHLPDGRAARLAYLSPATKADPAIQGQSFFYTAAAESGLLPGLNLLAALPAPAPAGAVVVPPAAVVWQGGKAWFYLRNGGQSFTRRLLPTDRPAPDGGYVVEGLPAGTAVVVRGAQALLSEEFRAQIEVGD